MSFRSQCVRRARSWSPTSLVAGLAFALIAACASSTPSGDVVEKDASLVPTPDGGGRGGFGDPCTSDTECLSGLCYDGTCNRACDFDCPDGYACRTVQIAGNDARLCVPAVDALCEPCQTDEECGDDSDACVQLTGGKFCARDCFHDATVCPAGFSCQILGTGPEAPRRQCLPISGVCCADADDDRHGDGAQCLDVDCDDTEPEVFVGHPEVCDGLDNDCSGSVDDAPIDCAAPMCELGQLGYFERGGDQCLGAGGCQQQEANLCGLYTCEGGGELGDRCATACDLESDRLCVDRGHCDGSVCYDDAADGEACDESSDCASGHCQNGYCCAFGDCCQTAMDCPTFGTFSPVCDSAPTCQGARGAAICTAGFTCGVQSGVADDSACDASVTANDCGWWLPVRCTGATSQIPPACPTTCVSDADCDSGGWCDPSSDTCREDLEDGQACGADGDRCKSGHCQNGFCCAGGDCCASASDCPSRYSSPPICTSPTACDGEVDVAACVGSTCSTAENVDDDSACGVGTPASDCGPYRPVFCTGASTQTVPPCPTACSGDAECDGDAYCNPQGRCVPDLPAGGACQDAGECQSGHCQNGFCCASGDCCAQSTDCDAYDGPAVCDVPGNCEGSRVAGVCSAAKQCAATTVADDSGCAGIESSECGPYPATVCTFQVAQSPPVCPSSCTSDAGCDVSAHCAAGVCAPDQGPGGYCTSTSECGGGLSCVDNVCCSSACNGPCEACDLPGSVGQCRAVPAGADPDNECGDVSCAGYYQGWSGDSCRRVADVPANVAACNGALACRSAAVECAAYGVPGPVATTCHGECQDPVGSTCAGTVAGACSNTNPGTQACGVGQCARTAPICANGAPATCTPGSPSAETCNDLDDNCDSVIDNGGFSDAYEPNPDCSSVRQLGGVGSDQSNTYTSMTVYGAGDDDYYRIPMAESDNSCGCGSFSLDEDYRASVTLTVPSGAGSFQLCMNVGSCGWADSDCVEIAEGTSATLQRDMDGQCLIGTTDSYTIYVRVRGDNAPGMECRPYTLAYNFDAGRCR